MLRPPAWNLSKVLRYLVSPVFELLLQAQRLCFCWHLLLPRELVSCRLYLPLSPLLVGMPASLTSRSFLVKSLADFAAGLDIDLLLCPVWALRFYLLRTRSLSPRHHRLFVSPRRPSRAMSKNAVSFFLREVITAAGAARPEVGSLRAHEVRSVSTSVGFLCA